MTRKLILLNLLLLFAVVAAAWKLRQNWIEARAREQAVLLNRPKPLPPPPVTFSKPVEPVLAASYADIALKMLFSKDRNPTVVVEEKPVIPKPMPPLPLLYGVMSLPDGTTAVMSEKAGARHLGIRPGEKVGEFTLVTVSSEDITLEWDGKQVVKRIDELIDRAGPPPAAVEGTPRPAAAAAGQSSAQTDTKPTGKPEPGVEVGAHIRACQAGDTSPAGTVSAGYIKKVTPTPFGDQCRWEPM